VGKTSIHFFFSLFSRPTRWRATSSRKKGKAWSHGPCTRSLSGWRKATTPKVPSRYCSGWWIEKNCQKKIRREKTKREIVRAECFFCWSPHSCCQQRIGLVICDSLVCNHEMHRGTPTPAQFSPFLRGTLGDLSGDLQRRTVRFAVRSHGKHFIITSSHTQSCTFNRWCSGAGFFCVYLLQSLFYDLVITAVTIICDSNWYVCEINSGGPPHEPNQTKERRPPQRRRQQEIWCRYRWCFGFSARRPRPKADRGRRQKARHLLPRPQRGTYMYMFIVACIFYL